jgi:hypothetical protein
VPCLAAEDTSSPGVDIGNRSRANYRMRARDPHDDPPPSGNRCPIGARPSLGSPAIARLPAAADLLLDRALPPQRRRGRRRSMAGRCGDPGPMPQSCLHQVRHDRHRCTAELARPIGAGESDWRIVALRGARETGRPIFLELLERSYFGRGGARR